MENKIKFLEENGVDIDVEEGAERYIVCHDDVTDAGPYGFYPTWSEFDSLEEAVNFSCKFIDEGLGVSSIANNY